MNYIAHRINTVSELLNVEKEYGVEVDIRDYNNKLVLQHDPFKDGECFEYFLQNYTHGTLILNIKSERIEFDVINLLKKYNINDYFFLDSSFPMIYLLTEKGESKIAVRYSEFESFDTVLKMKGKIDWVWIDCFTKIPLTYDEFCLLKKYNFKLCFVSPDLQAQNNKIEKYRSFFQSNNITLDAVCVKKQNINRWKN